jgi:hypothetical protein
MRESPDDNRRSRWVTDALDALWLDLVDDEGDYGLLPQLDPDAALARARRGELRPATPRLLSLVVDHALAPGLSAETVSLVGAGSWSPPHRVAIERVLDAWWRETLERAPGSSVPDYPPSVVLGVVCGFDAPLIRWLEPWLDALDGPGAHHLADVILAGPAALTGPAWEGKADQAGQVLGWARTEPVVNGLALVGGVHLEADTLSRVLDAVI